MLVATENPIGGVGADSSVVYMRDRRCNRILRMFVDAR